MSTTAAQAKAQFLKFCIQYASIALIYYDYILTLRLEIDYMWRSKLRISTVLYFFTRYALLANILYLLAISSKLSKVIVSCDAWYRTIGILSVLGRASVIIVLSARTYAVWNKNKLILVWLSALGVTCVVLDAMPGLIILSNPYVTVLSHANFSQVMYFFLTFADTTEATLLSVLVCVLELSVAILTVIHAVRSTKARPLEARDLPGFLYRQGVLYFCCVFLFTTAAMILNFTVSSSNFLIKILNAITLPLSCLLTGRFLLDLRSVLDKQSKQTQSDHSVQERSAVSSISFGVAAMVDEFASTDPQTVATGAEGDEARGAADEQDYDGEFRASHDQNYRIESIVVEV